MLLNDENKCKSRVSGRSGVSSLWIAPLPELHGNKSRLDRCYCTSGPAMEALFSRMEIAGMILDLCGGSDDGLSAAFTGRYLVIANDIDPM